MSPPTLLRWQALSGLALSLFLTLHLVNTASAVFGPEVYDRGLHGGLAEPGYLENCLTMHRMATDALGSPLDGKGYERLQHGALDYRGDWAVQYDPSPRQLTRHWSRADTGVLDDLSPRHYRRIRHRHWEVAAFNYLYGDDIEGFIADNPVIAEIL